MTTFFLEQTRGRHVESVQRVSLAVTDADGRLLAAAGSPTLATFWRSAAKPFQAVVALEAGVEQRYGLDARMLALACASHGSDPEHLAVADAMLGCVGVGEGNLACGTHPPLDPAVAARVARDGVALTPRWSNCSGKHTLMLAACRAHGWPLEGYTSASHPLAGAIRQQVLAWSGVAADDLDEAVDGCAALTYYLPLTGMARAWARFGVADAESPAGRLREAMTSYPHLVAGQARLCTDLMAAAHGTIVAKVGAAGIYCAAIPAARVGVALKLEDGADLVATQVALVGALRLVLARVAPALLDVLQQPAVARHAAPAVRNTRGDPVGVIRAVGALQWG